jgi:hypothetical protein
LNLSSGKTFLGEHAISQKGRAGSAYAARIVIGVKLAIKSRKGKVARLDCSLNSCVAEGTENWWEDEGLATSTGVDAIV